MKTVPTWLCVLTPLLLFAVLLTLALHVRLGLGHWPVPVREDYSTAAFRLHFRALVAVAFVTVYVAGPVWFVLLCFRRLRLTWKYHLTQAGVYAAGWALIGAWCWVDPWRFFGWLAD